MEKPRRFKSVPPRKAEEEAAELFQLLAAAPDEPGEAPPVEGDMLGLLQRLGGRSREGDEHETRSLLEGLPDLPGEPGGLLERKPMAGKGKPRAEAGPQVEVSAGRALGRGLEGHPVLPGGGAASQEGGRLEEGPRVGFRDLFGAVGGEASLAGEGAEEAGVEAEVEAEAGGARDPLGPRRAMADRRIKLFVQEELGSLEALRLVRFFMVSGLERIRLEELEEALVERASRLEAQLGRLVGVGLLVAEGGGYSLNPRARKLSVAAAVVARWQSPRSRVEVYQWLEELGTG